jgi:hypothetical protein
MALNFPNESRSYDSRKRCVRFWAHDASFEIPFFLNADALFRIAPDMNGDESSLLTAFDHNLERIHAAAGRVYARDRGGRGSYTLSARDL